ncbi:hypothetical protein GCM10007979_10520 [Nocardioides albus]|nr:hypothetical protein GCM10007979_10520 [Nocardioides albus]
MRIVNNPDEPCDSPGCPSPYASPELSSGSVLALHKSSVTPCATFSALSPERKDSADVAQIVDNPTVDTVGQTRSPAINHTE